MNIPPRILLRSRAKHGAGKEVGADMFAVSGETSGLNISNRDQYHLRDTLLLYIPDNGRSSLPCSIGSTTRSPHHKSTRLVLSLEKSGSRTEKSIRLM
jgi:hypothetical protein